jgi:hypothetical protein
MTVYLWEVLSRLYDFHGELFIEPTFEVAQYLMHSLIPAQCVSLHYPISNSENTWSLRPLAKEEV